MSKERKISDIIDQSLFLLGAGFSRGAGCLTSAQMFDDIKERIFTQKSRISLSPVQKETLKFLISCLQYHSEWRTMETANNFKFTPNIEELALLIRRVKNRENFLPYPITGNWADKLVQLESEFSAESKDGLGLFESLENILKELLKEEWLSVPDEKNLSYLQPLSDFFKAYPDDKFRLNVFSLNYDTVLEQFFKEDGEVPWRGFSSNRWVSVLPDEENDPNGRVNLYKIHGSIDWVRMEDMDTYEEAALNGLLKDTRVEHDPYIIFGQGTKSFSVEPFFSLIHHFNKSLVSPDIRYFFVIGYSFFDPYINNLLFNAVKRSKKLIIVNPTFGFDKTFQEEEWNGWKRPKANPEDFFRAIYRDDKNKSNLTDFLREIQKNSFYSELPEFNYLTLSAENVEYLPLTAEEFLENFFKDKGDLLQKYIDGFEEQRQKEEQPF
ncbi:MAG: SIR2 family protein [Rhodospirillales bacterium]|nr:SIR2 family protein [Rhodospirillales bacterium]